MTTMDRRKFLAAALGGAGATVALASGAAALPLDAAAERHLADRMKDDVKRAQAVVVRGRPRRRRWVCWWRRGRRVCGWRWV
jgi:hypothetical protein